MNKKSLKEAINIRFRFLFAARDVEFSSLIHLQCFHLVLEHNITKGLGWQNRHRNKVNHFTRKSKKIIVWKKK